MDNKKYYAMVSADKNDDGETLYFWYGRFARRDVPSDYGWSPLEGDQSLDDWDSLHRFLVNTLALDIDRGDCDEEFVDNIEIHCVETVTETVTEETEVDGKKKRVVKTVETQEDLISDYKVTMEEVTEVGEEKYGWNDAEPYNICPSCGEDGWQGDICPNCGYDLH